MRACLNTKCVGFGHIVYSVATRCPLCRWDLKSVLPGHAPKSGERQCRRQIPRADIRMTVTFSRQRQHRIRPSVHLASDAPREVHAEKGKAWVGHGIDEGVHQRSPLRHQIVVFAAEWNNHHSGVIACHPADAVAEQSSTVYDCIRREHTLSGLDYDFRREPPHAHGGC